MKKTYKPTNETKAAVEEDEYLVNVVLSKEELDELEKISKQLNRYLWQQASYFVKMGIDEHRAAENIRGVK